MPNPKIRPIIRIAKWSALGGAVLFQTSCSVNVSDVYQKTVDLFTLSKQSILTLVTNSTTLNQPPCAKSNTVTLERSFPGNRVAYCRENSRLSSDLTPGPVCSGGVVLGNIDVSPQVKPCSQMTICGVAATTVEKIGTRTDGGTVDLVRFDNLPWGCDAEVQSSLDPAFPAATTSSLKFFVQPPSCPFCTSQNKTTCETCRDLGSEEEVIAGFVVKKCTGNDCRACTVLGVPTETVPHKTQRRYYDRTVGECGNKCVGHSQIRVCNDGNWEGPTSFNQPQCFDNSCGCTWPGDTITYAHNASTTYYKAKEPECSDNDCSHIALTVKCNDGTWRTGSGSNERNVTDAEKSTFAEKVCNRKTCHCIRPGRDTVSDLQTKKVYKTDVVSCSQSCEDATNVGAVKCVSGTLFGDPASRPDFLSYLDTCKQQDCGCRINLANGEFVFLANGGSQTFFKFSENSVAVPNACTDAASKVTVSCTGGVASSYPANALFKTCTTRPLSCKFTDGSGQQTVVESGQRITVAKELLPACGVACQNLELLCENTIFKKQVGSAWQPVDSTELGQYRSSTVCTPRNCDCRLGGNILPYNTTGVFYKINEGRNCDPQQCNDNKATITCTANGPTSSRGDDANEYIHRTCEVIPCGCKTPQSWGGDLRESGTTFLAYKIPAATCADENACGNAANSTSIQCVNGVNTPSIPEDTYGYCRPPVCSCFHDGVRTPVNQKLRVYQTKNAPAGVKCSSLSTLVTCTEGGRWAESTIGDYPYASCVDVFTDSGDGGGTGGGTGNGDGPGSAIKKRLGLGDDENGFTPCLSVSSCKKVAVSVNNEHLRKDPCILPWGFGEVEMFGTIGAFDKECVVLPDTCAKHSITRMCHIKGWDGPSTYRFNSCVEKAVCP